VYPVETLSEAIDRIEEIMWTISSVLGARSEFTTDHRETVDLNIFAAMN
jgi:hypothetical protein